MAAPRVLILLDTTGTWSRGILRGFIETARERDWSLLHYNSSFDLKWLREQWAPDAVVAGPGPDAGALREFFGERVVSVTMDRSRDGIASVCLDEESIARMAFDHLRGIGLSRVTTFRFDESPFAVARERAFIDAALAAKLSVPEGWGAGELPPERRREDPAAIVAWLQGLPKPCGVFTCTDGWARTVVRCAALAGLRIPEDVSLIGADNDVLECELITPPLSSVMIPWRELGKSAASLVRRLLAGEALDNQRLVKAPLTVVARRSTDASSIEDEPVARAVAWIAANHQRRITVSMVARAVASGRQRLERAFRRVLGRTIQEEIRRTRVEAAKALLIRDRGGLAALAKQCGFTTASLMNAAFQRELGMSPGVYRRRAERELTLDNDD